MEQIVPYQLERPAPAKSPGGGCTQASVIAGPVKIHIGCGTRKLHGWVNVDVDPDVRPDRVDNVFLTSFAPGCATVIYACHVLEHVARNSYLSVLAAWFDRLAPGGVVRIAVPDFGQVAWSYIEQKAGLSELLGFLVGGQKTQHDFHEMVFDQDSLAEALTRVGFVNVRAYDWRKTEHHYVDDYSQAYLPHMDKIHDTLMSLNVEADKP